MSSLQGIIDLGTNTFHLLIVENYGNSFTNIFHESRPARIGLGGINQRIITPEAYERAIHVLLYFREKLNQLGVQNDNTFAFGTSAIRNADNREDFCSKIFEKTGIEIQVIDGNKEAEYIYKGVKSGADIGDNPSLIMDIGGGSVEFIIGNKNQIFWKQSFEIGGQRLMEKFMRNDPLSQRDRTNLNNYFEENLIPLANAVHQYAPEKLVGSSGTFDTLIDIDYHFRENDWPPKGQTDFGISIEAFYRSYALILSGNHNERLLIPGMIELRVDMIVVAVCLIDYVLKTYAINKIQVSSYALKEGVLAELLSR
ncbi:Ppx/GppA phosphatase family protein [Dyadobacter arcticus]|uniref:Exopolyphosphatase/guanosine-5'-triphosphate, 3'-diphosphate pyrophosphatase n=1 Tax=Dyadobacter arcticus TaxID=1078754 RepID=A0ABX0USP7_9BACT|nr:phosphatase [Dyadobacter arcticus]NIJ55997.1 exopolyphosphatase/guanosine-5'-triphosphate,3'-diphosphate pyrophosphatase [Dyadobacter arcticus]